MPLARLFPAVARKTLSWPLPGRIAVAIAIVGAVTFFRDAGATAWHLPKVPLLTYILPVVISSSLLGRAPGLLTVLLAAAIVSFRYLTPENSILVDETSERAAVLLFLCIGSLVSLIIGWMQEAMAKLAVSEHGRGMLLYEFRHRSRNDLASLSSLLTLRAKRAPPEAQVILKEAANHAFALARIHTRLLDAKIGLVDGAIVHTQSFVTKLVRELLDDCATQHAEPELRIMVEDHPLQTERAVQLGLILHKAVSNAVLYAQTPGRRLLIEVQFVRHEGNYLLSVTDNGIGMPERRTPTFGDRMLQGMAAQLRGSFSRSSQPDVGTSCELCFPTEVSAPLHAFPH